MTTARSDTISRWIRLIDEGQGYSGFDAGFYRQSLNCAHQYRFCDVLLNHTSVGSSVLEAGCGSAFYSFFLAGQDRRVTAVDVDHKLIHELKGFTGQLGGKYSEHLDLISMDFFDLDRLNRQFDLIFSDGTYEHFMQRSDRMEMLGLFGRHLVDGGKCILTVPNLHNPFYRAVLHRKIPEMMPFTFKSLSSELESAGFRVIEIGCRFVNPGFEQWLNISWLQYPIRAARPVFNRLPKFLQTPVASHLYCVGRKLR